MKNKLDNLKRMALQSTKVIMTVERYIEGIGNPRSPLCHLRYYLTLHGL